MAGGVGSAGFEHEKGTKWLIFDPVEPLFKVEQGITLFYRLGRGFLGQIVLDQEDRQGPKSYHGGEWAVQGLSRARVHLSQFLPFEALFKLE